MSRPLEGRAAIGHLLRRASFGPSPALLDAVAGRTYADVVDELTDGLRTEPADPPASFDPYVPGAIQQAWLERMLSGVAPLAEKLTLFWHGHFATSDAKVQDPLLLWRQNDLFRRRGAGRFRDLVRAVSRDAAMIVWLDGNSNRRGHPNENFARELQELFVLGVGNYTEQDVREVARAFTGWGTHGGAFHYAPHFHDEGTKTIHGKRGNLDGDDVVDLLTASDAASRFLAEKLLRFFSHPTPTTSEVAALARVLSRSGGDVAEALRSIFLSPGFLDVRRSRALVRAPVDFVLSALHAVGADEIAPWVQPALERMGQVLFRPPSVKGWPEGGAWLSSAALLSRIRAATRASEGIRSRAEADAAIDRIFDGRVPRAILRLLRSRSPRNQVALALASPEAQLA